MKIDNTDLIVAVDNEGYLQNPADWTIPIAQQIAVEEGIEMEAIHWFVVHFIRDYYEQNQVVPGARFALKSLEENYGKDRATRKSLYGLFPYGYGQQACKIAGMRKPLKLMLDI